ncbi:FHA domain-containing protein [Fontimonas sp. SYSU GA230001]|uniref:FHA domain-containing protein n=1 Tax=Fontimonas sp. SYSU GA230001 TaxID=3142450 RepID=UPI0032B3780E
MILIRRFDPEGARTEQGCEGSISIGRATDNTIQLPGLLVALHHLRVSPAGGMRLQMDVLSTAGVIVNGAPVQGTTELLPGDELGIGGHRVHIGVDDARSAPVLEVHEHDARAAAERTGGQSSLDRAGWRMRRPALIGLGLVLVLTLIVPLILRALPLPVWVGDWAPSERLWSSGRISNAHAHFGQQCGVCHESLFVRVRDQACLGCHATIKHHGDDAQGMAAAGLDDRRCASCHFEHGDAHAVLPQHPATCTGCHATPQDFAALSGVGAVTDFARKHPPFRTTATVLRDGQRETRRAELTPGTRDQSGLIYPHDLHLNPKGIRGENGKEVLQCADCHRPGAGDVGFAPVRFERDCQRCHQLDVTLGGLPFRLPHGDSDAVRSLLEGAVGMKPVAAPKAADVQGEDRRRPGVRAERGDDTGSASEIDGIFERQVCAKCHEVTRTEGQVVAVSAPALRQTWMPMARFTHAPHQWVSCEVCHAASTSSDSNDLLLPQIETCRGCHGGVGSDGKIQSTCIDCHRFHQAATLSMSKLPGKLANAQTSEMVR